MIRLLIVLAFLATGSSFAPRHWALAKVGSPVPYPTLSTLQIKPPPFVSLVLADTHFHFEGKTPTRFELRKY